MQRSINTYLFYFAVFLFLASFLINKIDLHNYSDSVNSVTINLVKVDNSESIKNAIENLIKPQNTIYKEKDIKIFTYHYVEYVTDNKDTLRKSLNIEPHTFEEHLKLIKQKQYKDIFIKEVPSVLANNDKNKYVALTFDDGYRDFYEYAFPLIKKYNIKATVYVVPSLLNKQNYLTYSQLTEISQSDLVEIGSHGMNHIDLTSKIANPQYEIVESKKYLENILNTRIYSFCYPYGRYNNNLIEVVKKANYLTAVSTDEGSIQSGNNIFKLHRIRAGGLPLFIK